MAEQRDSVSVSDAGALRQPDQGGAGSLLDAIALPVWRLDAARRIVELNGAARSLFQLAGEKPAIGLDWQAMIHPSDQPNLQAALEASLSTDEEVSCELRFMLPGASLGSWFRCAIRRLRSQAQAHLGWACYARNVHEPLLRLDLLEQRELQFEAIFGSAEMGSWRITQGDPYLVEADDRFRANWALPAAPVQLRVADLMARIHPDDRDNTVRLMTMAWTSGVADGVYRIVLPDGRIRWQRSQSTRTTDRVSKRLQLVGVNADITERRNERDALRLSAQRLQIALASSGLTLFTMDRDLRFTWIQSPEPGSMKLIGKRDDERGMRADEASALMAFKQTVLDTGIGGRRLFSLTIDDINYFIETTLEPLRDHQGRIDGLVGASFNVTRQRRAEIELRNSELRRDDFLSVLAHELRNPLAPIRNALALMRHIDLPEKAAGLMPVVERQVAQITRLVDDLLDVSRITTGRLQVRLERADLNEIARRSAGSYQLLIEQASRRLEVSLSEQPLMADVDPIRIEQVLGNLLNNALKFTPAGGRVRIESCADGDQALIRVSDTGIGFLDAQIPRMFEKFAQLPGGVSASNEGLGVGLHLARELVLLQDGSITARSDGPGQGSTFTVGLPLARKLAKVEENPLTRRAPDSDFRAEILDILVVDDNPDVLETTSLLLQSWGYHTRTAHDGASGLLMLSGKLPDVVLMDLGMPRMDGYEMARRIRGLPDGGSVRLVALSGWGQPADRQRSLAAGADEHLVKPVDPERLRQLLDRYARH